MSVSVLERIRGAVESQRVRISDHALDELVDENLLVVDAESALLTGTITRTQGPEPGLPGPRYTVVGMATDLSTKLAVICRFDEQEFVLLVTAYEVKQ